MSKPREPIDLSCRLGLSLPEAATALAVSANHLRNHIHEIPHAHIGNRLVFPVEAVRAWLTDRANAEQRSSEEVANQIVEEMTHPRGR